jgi:hypothetical protein
VPTQQRTADVALAIALAQLQAAINVAHAAPSAVGWLLQVCVRACVVC